MMMMMMILLCGLQLLRIGNAIDGRRIVLMVVLPAIIFSFCVSLSLARALDRCGAGIVVSRHIYLPAFFLRSLRVREFKIHGILLPKSTLYDKAFLTRCLLWGVKKFIY